MINNQISMRRKDGSFWTIDDLRELCQVASCYLDLNGGIAIAIINPDTTTDTYPNTYLGLCTAIHWLVREVEGETYVQN